MVRVNVPAYLGVANPEHQGNPTKHEDLRAWLEACDAEGIDVAGVVWIETTSTDEVVLERLVLGELVVDRVTPLVTLPEL